jgi:hypothetical protein
VQSEGKMENEVKIIKEMKPGDILKLHLFVEDPCLNRQFMGTIPITREFIENESVEVKAHLFGNLITTYKLALKTVK